MIEDLLRPSEQTATSEGCDCCLCQGEHVHRSWDWAHRCCRACGFEAKTPDTHAEAA